MEKIIFCCPGLKIGGAELLFIRCAKWLAENTDNEIFYFDYETGFAHGELKDSDVIFLDYNNNGKNTLLENSILIVPLPELNRIKDKFILTKNNYFLFWSINPLNLSAKIQVRHKFYLVSKFYRRKIGLLIKELSEIGIIKYMDYNNYISASNAYLFNAESIKYLPVPIDDRAIIQIESIKKQMISKEKISLLWLSRLDSDKKNTLLTIMNELENIHLHSEYSIILHIIGNGTELNNIQYLSSKYKYEIVFHGTKYGTELDNFIDSNIDIGIAMGTSALEIAKRGKPVIVKGFLPRIFKSGKLKDYIFLHEEYGFSLDSPSFIYRNQSDFENKFYEIINHYSDISSKCYEYTRDKHGLTSVLKELIYSINNISNLNDQYVLEKVNLSSKLFQSTFMLKLKYRISNFRRLK